MLVQRIDEIYELLGTHCQTLGAIPQTLSTTEIVAALEKCAAAYMQLSALLMEVQRAWSHSKNTVRLLKYELNTRMSNELRKHYCNDGSLAEKKNVALFEVNLAYQKELESLASLRSSNELSAVGTSPSLSEKITAAECLLETIGTLCQVVKEQKQQIREIEATVRARYNGGLSETKKPRNTDLEQASLP